MGHLCRLLGILIRQGRQVTAWGLVSARALVHFVASGSGISASGDSGPPGGTFFCLASRFRVSRLPPGDHRPPGGATVPQYFPGDRLAVWRHLCLPAGGGLRYVGLRRSARLPGSATRQGPGPGRLIPKLCAFEKRITAISAAFCSDLVLPIGRIGVRAGSSRISARLENASQPLQRRSARTWVCNPQD